MGEMSFTNAIWGLFLAILGFVIGVIVTLSITIPFSWIAEALAELFQFSDLLYSFIYFFYVVPRSTVLLRILLFSGIGSSIVSIVIYNRSRRQLPLIPLKFIIKKSIIGSLKAGVFVTFAYFIFYILLTTLLLFMIGGQ